MNSPRQEPFLLDLLTSQAKGKDGADDRNGLNQSLRNSPSTGSDNSAFNCCHLHSIKSQAATFANLNPPARTVTTSDSSLYNLITSHSNTRPRNCERWCKSGQPQVRSVSKLCASMLALHVNRVSKLSRNIKCASDPILWYSQLASSPFFSRATARHKTTIDC